MKYVEVSVDLDIDLVAPSIKKAEKRFIVPILGREFYREVLAYKNVVPTEIQKELLDAINSAAAPLAMWYYCQVGGVSIDGSGIYKPKNDNRWNLGDAEQKRLEGAFLNSGLDALDDLLNFLNDNLSSFDTYATSEEREETFTSLVPTAKIVQKVFTMLHPQVTFRALREAIRYVEPRVAEAMQEFYFHCVDSAAASTPLSLTEKRMRTMAEKAVIYMAAERALLTRTVKLTNEGLEVMMGDRTQVSEAENSRIEAAARTYQRSGEVEFANLISAMNANPPTGYVVPVAPEIVHRVKCGEDSKVIFL